MPKFSEYEQLITVDEHEDGPVETVTNPTFGFAKNGAPGTRFGIQERTDKSVGATKASVLNFFCSGAEF